MSNDKQPVSEEISSEAPITSQTDHEKSDRRESKIEGKGFPLEIFPAKIQELILSLKRTRGMPIDFSAASFLYAISIAIGNSCSTGLDVQAPQYCMLYMVLIGKPNTNKSGPLKFMLDPLQELDKASFQKYHDELTNFQAYSNLSVQDQKIHGGGPLMKPIFKKFIIQDTTIEALKQIVFDNPRGIGFYRDELLGWINDLNRYNGGSDIQFFLQNWSGNPISCDRKGSDPIYINNPFIGVAGTVQPKVLEQLARGERADNGFIDRFMFIFPDNLTKADWGLDYTPMHLIEEYSLGIKKLAEYGYQEDGIDMPKFIPISPRGKILLLQFLNNRNKPLSEDAPTDALAGSFGKLDLYTFRFILIIHRVYWAFDNKHEEEISEDTVFRAIQFTEYIRKMTRKAYAVIFDATPIERLPKNKAELYRLLPEQLSTGEGLELARKMGITDRVFKGMLNDKQLFDKIYHGHYAKKY